MDTQARIPAALAALHNFIRRHDPREIDMYDGVDDLSTGCFPGSNAELKTDESGTGESRTGESGTGESGAGESGAGESRAGESGADESRAGESGTDERERAYAVRDQIAQDMWDEYCQRSDQMDCD